MSSDARGRLLRIQDRLAWVLGCKAECRPAIVTGMLHRNNDAAGYWLQLVVSLGIATLGLVLGSSAVVIGAMLIAPLMTPLVSLGMGLAVGSPFLVLRSSVRVVASVVVAIGSSALITRLLPFNDLNAEIASRTTPTALDLFVAAFCALAGVYAVMRRDSDVASTAAGTSIGISLVPPLCASGYGIGTSTWTVASGAALLFLTNFVAIVVVSTISFAASGFHQVDIQRLEAQELGTGENARGTRRLAKVFASRSGPWLRLLMPLVLLAAVYLPLRTALDEVVWQVSARKSVATVLAGLPHRLVQSRVHVERGRIELTLVLVGTSADATRARSHVEQEVRGQTGIDPRLEVLAIPDAAAFAGLEAALHRDAVPPPVRTRGPEQDISRTRSVIPTTLERRWPAASAGQIASISFRLTGPDWVIEIVHLGSALAPAAREVLERALREDLAGPVRLVTRALPADDLVPEKPGDAAFIAELATLVEIARSVDAISVCVIAPPAANGPAKKNGIVPATGPDALATLRMFEGLPRAQVTPGPAWRIRFVAGPCSAPVTASAAGTASSL